MTVTSTYNTVEVYEETILRLKSTIKQKPNTMTESEKTKSYMLSSNVKFIGTTPKT